MQEWTKPVTHPARVAFLLFDRFSNLCLANCLEPLRAANTLAGRQVYDWQFLTLDGQPVRSSSDLTILPQAPIDALHRTDLLYVIASYDHPSHDTRATRQALRQAAGRARQVIGLDSGPWLMAAAGLLDGRAATIHWDLLSAFSERFLKVDALRQPIVEDGNRVTCVGAMATYDLSLRLVRAQAGAALALDIEALFMHLVPARPAGPETRATKGDAALDAALARMHATLETLLRLTDIARAAGCQPKTLERKFQTHMGAAPGQVYRHMRLSAAHQLALTTALPVTEIALRCGYESPAAMTRAFRARFGTSPRDLRKLPR